MVEKKLNKKRICLSIDGEVHDKIKAINDSKGQKLSTFTELMYKTFISKEFAEANKNVKK